MFRDWHGTHSSLLMDYLAFPAARGRWLDWDSYFRCEPQSDLVLLAS